VLDPNTHAVVRAGLMSPRSFALTAFALTGFANFASVGIQLAALERLLRNGGLISPGSVCGAVRGFVVTLLNAAVSGVILE